MMRSSQPLANSRDINRFFFSIIFFLRKIGRLEVEDLHFTVKL